MNRAMAAIVQKDFKGVAANKRLFPSLLIVPLVLAVLFPAGFVALLFLLPEELGELEQLLALMPQTELAGGVERTVAALLLNHIMPVFFLIIPIMASSVMAASAFVGEKEKHTLETLLYCPLSLPQIFRAKVLAAFFLSMLVSLLSFGAMLAVVEMELYCFTGSFMAPGVSWPVILLLVAPAVSLIAVTLIVRGSARAQSVEESQQGAVFLILPLVLLVAGQFTGLLLISAWLLLGLGLVCALVAWLLLKRALGRFRYEALLK